MANPEKRKLHLRKRRAHRARARIFGTAVKPRLAVFRSNRHLYAQLIDDGAGRTVCAVSDLTLAKGKQSAGKGMERACALGKALAEAAVKQKVTSAVFDRGPYRFHGQVKALAEGAREGGLQF